MWYTLSQYYHPDDLTTAWSVVLVGIIAIAQIIGGPMASGKAHMFYLEGPFVGIRQLAL